MPNTSSTGGPLLPAVSPAPLEGIALEDFLHDLIVTLTGIPTLFPRWQPEPPDMPAYGTDWGAFGITSREADVFAVELHGSAAGVGYDELRRHEKMNILTSFYGPNADSYAAILRDDLQLLQNNEILQRNNMGLVETLDLIIIPELIKERWVRRVDIRVIIKRQIVRRYSVLNLASSIVQINNEKFVETINVI
jgi:hypothetical protein